MKKNILTLILLALTTASFVPKAQADVGDFLKDNSGKIALISGGACCGCLGGWYFVSKKITSLSQKRAELEDRKDLSVEEKRSERARLNKQIKVYTYVKYALITGAGVTGVGAIASTAYRFWPQGTSKDEDEDGTRGGKKKKNKANKDFPWLTPHNATSSSNETFGNGEDIVHYTHRACQRGDDNKTFQEELAFDGNRFVFAVNGDTAKVDAFMAETGDSITELAEKASEGEDIKQAAIDLFDGMPAKANKLGLNNHNYTNFTS